MSTRSAHVIGRGIVGLSLAYELSRRNWRISVVGPAARIGTASRAAVGVSSMKGQILVDQPLFAVKMYGHYGLKTWIESVEKASGRQIPHDFGGVYEPFSTVTEFEWIRERVFHRKLTGCLNARLLSREDWERQLFAPSGIRSDWRSAFHYSQDGWVDTVALLEALEVALLRAGSQFVDVEVRRIVPTGESDLTLETQAGPIVAPIAVVAAGVFSNEILAASGLQGLEQKAVPGETLSGHAAPRSAPVALRVAKLNFIQQGGKVRIGSSSRVASSAVDWGQSSEEVARLKAMAAKAFHWTEPTEALWGVRGRLRDRMPAIGQLFFPGGRKGPWVSLGYYKNGVQLSHLFAQKLASLLEGEQPTKALSPFFAGRFFP